MAKTGLRSVPWTRLDGGDVPFSAKTKARVRKRAWFACCLHPLVVKELLGGLSDTRATIVGVDLEAANRSNRFFGDFAVADGAERMVVRWEGDHEALGYRHVATTPSGVEIVECHDRGGGSGVFGTVAWFSLEQGDRKGRGGTSLSPAVAWVRNASHKPVPDTSRFLPPLPSRNLRGFPVTGVNDGR